MDLDKICYKNTPIKKVIFRIDFLAKVPELNESLPSEITDVIKNSFPIAEPKNVVARTLQISNTDVLDKNTTIKEWHFHTEERNATLIIREDSFAILINHYISFENINKVLSETIDVFFNHYKGLISRRIGLRYINEIGIEGENPFDWSEYINPNLTSIFNVTENPKNIIRAFHNLEIKIDEIMLKFQYGMINPDYPALIKKKIFILDLDASFTGILKHHEIDIFIKKQHTVIQNQFEYSITQNLREKFELK
jgi:uncharacterized protein (TIGR04255 family)